MRATAHNYYGRGKPPSCTATNYYGRPPKPKNEGRSAMDRKVQAEIEGDAKSEVARDLIGDFGHYITELDPGRFGVFDSDGVCHAIVRGKEAAKAAAMQLATEGKISR